MTDSRTTWANDTLRLLHTLPARNATALSLMYFSRLSPAEISARTGWGEQGVRAACASGLRELGRLLQAEAATTTPAS